MDGGVESSESGLIAGESSTLGGEKSWLANDVAEQGDASSILVYNVD